MFFVSDEIKRYSLHATDGIIGKCVDLLIEESTWTIRFLVVRAGTFMSGRKVLISPILLGDADWETKQIETVLTRDQVSNSPEYDENLPVSRELEKKYHEHYDWPEYWTGGELWGGFRYPAELADAGVTTIKGNEEYSTESELEQEEVPDLRSVEEIKGYYVHAKDGEIGHIENFLIDSKSWTLRYCIVDTRNWLPGKYVLVSPGWLIDVDWFEGTAVFGLTRDEIKNSPEYDPNEPFTRDDEIELYDHYGRPFYWTP